MPFIISNGYLLTGTQIMIGYYCAMVQIFSFVEKRDVLFKEANRIFHLSPNENICTITRMKNIHHLFYITSKIYMYI